MSVLPLADAAGLSPVARWTFAVRALLAAAALGAVAAGLLVSRDPQTQTIVPLSRQADTIVVLDVSASISADTYSRIGGTLAALSTSGGRLGLIVFSDQAYVALPPGTAAADLAPLVRYFTLPKQSAPGLAPAFPVNPWQSVFTAGTKISAGLELAHAVAVAGGNRRATVVLVSDLDDDPGDLTRLATIALAYRRDGIPLRIVGLNPTPSNATFFQRLVGPTGSLVQAPPLGQGPAPANRTPFPWPFVALGLGALLAVAARTAWAPVLAWGRS